MDDKAHSKEYIEATMTPLKRERNYQLLQAAAKIRAGVLSNIEHLADSHLGLSYCVSQAIAILTEIESRNK